MNNRDRTGLRIYLLGAPRIERDDRPIQFDTRKAIALLAYLAVTGEQPTRDFLATLLWPDYDQSSARGALRRTLSSLKTALAGNYLEINRETIGLNPAAPVWVDVKEFQDCLSSTREHGHAESQVCAQCLPPLSQAVHLYREEFLSGFTLRDSPNFDDWQFFQSESLRNQLAGALEKLALGNAASQYYENAIAHARQWLSLDPLREEAHRLLIRLYADSGQRNAALRQYRECVRILNDELDVAPLEETTQLYQAIKEQREADNEPGGTAGPEFIQALPASNASPARTDLTPTPQALPLVGRSGDLSALSHAYGQVGEDGYFIALEGEAGIGKTRLAEEFLAQANQRGAVALSARCYEGETHLAYGLFVEALRFSLNHPDLHARWNTIPQPWLAEAARLLPELETLFPGLPSAPALDRPGAQSRFFEILRQILGKICQGTPAGILLLDDLHWVDAASLDLLTYLVRRLRGYPLLILTTRRTDGALPNQRLPALLAEAQRAGLGARHSLQRLTRSDVNQLVQSAALTGEQHGDLSQQLYQEAEGLPFFVVEYLAGIRRAEDSPDSEKWIMPGSVRDLLHARLAAATETGKQLLAAAAVIGRSFDFDTLRAASGRSELETVEGLEALTALGLIREQAASELSPHTASAPVYDFSHDKLRSLVYEDTSLARRRLLHRRVAETLESQNHRRLSEAALAGQVAHHYQQAGMDAVAAEHFKRAGEHAQALFANIEAIAYYQSALALGHPQADELHANLGDLYTLTGEYSAALHQFETAASLSQLGQIARLEQKLGGVYQRMGDWDLAICHFQSALGALGEAGELALQAELFADLSRSAHHQGRAQEAEELACQALELAERTSDPSSLAQAHNTLGVLARSREDYDRARHHLEHSLQIANEIGDPGAQAAALNNLALVYGGTRTWEQAIQAAQTALDLCIQQGDRHREAALHNNLADLHQAAGQKEPAMEHLKKAVVIFAEIGVDAGAMKPEIWMLTEW